MSTPPRAKPKGAKIKGTDLTMEQLRKLKASLENVKIPKKDISVDLNAKPLGEGSFGKVYAGAYACQAVAVKVIGGGVTISKKQEKKLLEEAKTQMIMSFHPGCLRFLGYVNDGGMLALVT